MAVVAVSLLHTKPFFHDYLEHADFWKYFYFIIDQSARFAVPLFFIVSGYWWGVKLQSGIPVMAACRSTARRLVSILLFWTIVYILPYNVASIPKYGLLGPLKVSYWNLTNLVSHPHVLAMQSTKIHLWFLIALLYALAITSFLLATRQKKLLIATAAALYLAGLIGGAYSRTPIGVEYHLNTRNGPFFGTAFFVTGYFLSTSRPKSAWFRKGLALWGIGLICHAVESFLLWKFFHSYRTQDFVFGTYFMGVGAALVALSNHEFLRSVLLGFLGRFALGVYGVHFVFVELLQPLAEWGHSPFWDLVYSILVLLSSVAAVLLLSRSELTKKFVA